MDANYDEFRFFTGLRPSEQIALLVTDFDPVKRRLTINKARVAGIDKDSTKAGEARRVDLCPRARSVLGRQLALRARLQHEGRIHYDHIFFKDNGEPIRNLLYPTVAGAKRCGGCGQSATANPTVPGTRQ